MAPPKKYHEPVTLRLPKDLLEKIDQVRRQQTEIPSRQDVIRQILDDYFEKNG
ncbi:ribbon-helix-helix domain-containing protein [Martelella sp. AMO21009]